MSEKLLLRPATFGAGCYWGTERYFKKTFEAVISQCAVGFMGGGKQQGTVSYEEVCSGKTGHAEVFNFLYDSSQVQYQDLVAFFFRMHNSTTLNQQCGDKGTQYRSVIFYHDEKQLVIAKDYIQELETGKGSNDASALNEKFRKAFGENSKVVTSLEPASEFFPAKAEHQAYLEKFPGGYCSHKMYY